jgi:hypothetical protein
MFIRVNIDNAKGGACPLNDEYFGGCMAVVRDDTDCGFTGGDGPAPDWCPLRKNSVCVAANRADGPSEPVERKTQ